MMRDVRRMTLIDDSRTVDAMVDATGCVNRDAYFEGR
jgi:hypothetical protein